MIGKSITVKFKDKKSLNSLFGAPYHFKLVDLIFWVEERFGRVCIAFGYCRGSADGFGDVPCTSVAIRAWVYDDYRRVIDEINSEWNYSRRKDGKCASFMRMDEDLIKLTVTPETIYAGAYMKQQGQG